MANSDSGNDDKARPVSLPVYMDLAVAGELKEGLQSALVAGGDIVLDASGVENITSPCIQVLLAAEKSAAADGRAIRLLAASEGFERAFQDLGLVDHFESWSNNQ